MAGVIIRETVIILCQRSYSASCDGVKISCNSYKPISVLEISTLKYHGILYENINILWNLGKPLRLLLFLLLCSSAHPVRSNRFNCFGARRSSDRTSDANIFDCCLLFLDSVLMEIQSASSPLGFKRTDKNLVLRWEQEEAMFGAKVRMWQVHNSLYIFCLLFWCQFHLYYWRLYYFWGLLFILCWSRLLATQSPQEWVWNK